LYLGRVENHRGISIKKLIGAAFSGLLLTASFPDIGSPLLAWIALVPIMAAARDTSYFDSFRLGFLSGFIHFVTLLYWFIPCLKTYGMIPLYLSIVILLVFASYLSFYMAAFSITLVSCCRSIKLLVFAGPLVWVAFEYARSIIFTGFPWELLGYSQYRILPLIQISDILGVYGVSYLLALANCVLFCLYLSVTRQKWGGQSVSKKMVVAPLVFFTLTLAAVWFYGVFRIDTVGMAATEASTKNIAVIQGNIDQMQKWDPAFQIETIDRYVTLSQGETPTGSDLIIWPETSMPFYFGHNVPLTNRVFKGIGNTSADFIISSPAFIRRGNNLEYRNRAFLITPSGKTTGIYDKAHLVPFGEYIPLKKWLPFLGKIVAQVGDFSPGEKGNTLAWEGHHIGMLICYEMIFPYLSRAHTQNQADLLINITNDAWYGKTSAPYQHFSMAVFRAVEQRRSLARSANTGVSGFIDPTGKIIAATPIFEEAAISAPLPLITISSLYTRFGDWFSLGCVVLLLVMIVRRVIDNILKKAED